MTCEWIDITAKIVTAVCYAGTVYFMVQTVRLQRQMDRDRKAHEARMARLYSERAEKP